MLTENGIDVVVLEARDRVGGRTFTKRDTHKNLWTDLGGSYVGPTQDCILRLIEELGLKTYLVDQTKDWAYMATSTTLDNNNNYSCVIKRKKFSNVESVPVGGFITQLDFNNVIRLIDAMGRQIPSEAPWNCVNAREWDSMTFRQFIDKVSWTKNVRDFLNDVLISTEACCESTDASLLWFLWYISQCGGFGRLVSASNGAQERKVIGGTQQISERIVNLIGKDKVLLNKPVMHIDQTTNKPLVTVTTLDGSQYKAKYIVMAIAPHLHLKIHFQPSLPPVKNLLAQRSPMGTVAKIILYYERNFWKEQGYCGSFFINSNDHFNYPVALAFDETKPDGSHPSIIGFVTARSWYETQHLTQEEMVSIVAKSYAQATNCDQFLTPVHVEYFDWTHEQYSGGCYPTYYSTGVLSKFGPFMRQPFDRIHYGGTELAIKWSGYMDGAVSSGERAAREVLNKLGKLNINEIWQLEPPSKVVPPKEFHHSWWHLNSPSIETLIKVASGSAFVSLVALHIFLLKGRTINWNPCSHFR